jgi:glycosyltransferase involved in cell wall biosynthesis
MPRFSIVTSFFGDDPSYIYRLYECAKAQNVDWEWVVTDDFSDNPETDKTLIEISKADSRVRRIIQTEKRQFFRNPSLYAKGEFVFHIDADDLYHPSYLEDCESWFDRLPEVVCILSASRWIKKSGVIERYFTHNPFLNPFMLNGRVMPPLNYLGRVWRNNIKIDWSGIFPDETQMIRMNDKYIVNYLSTKGEVLCLPRCYIEYETAKVSNSSIQRSSEEAEMIRKVDSEFEYWHRNNKKEMPYHPYFFTGDGCDFELDCFPFLSMDWDNTKSMDVYGFSDLLIKRKLLRQLFRGIEINFNLDKPKSDTVVICGEYKQDIDLTNKKVFVLTKNNEDISFYFQYLQKNKKRFHWFKYDKFCWMKTI